MIRTDKRLRLCKTLMVVLLCFIWGNSLIPANFSLSISEWVRMILTGAIPEETADGWASLLVRKLAHFTEFAALGMCVAWLHGMLGKRKKGAFVWCVLAACVDECIQFLAPGRAPRLYDVVIDSSGAAAGMMLLYFGHTYLKKRSTNQSLEDK